MKDILFKDLGLIDYKEAWDYQESLFEGIVKIKLSNRQLPDDKQQATKNYLLFCEHPHVYTLGKSGSESNLLINQIQLLANNATFYKINRGGDITYHGPEQIVGYPIIDLDNFFPDIHKYVSYIEETIIRTLSEYDIKAGRLKGATGVWLDAEGKNPRKICAIGIRASRWVTMHGFAFNVNTNLNYFSYINPCGFTDKGVTSMQKELGQKFNLNEIKEKLKIHFANIFEAKLIMF